MITKIIRIRGTSSKVTIKCEGINVIGNGEFFSKGRVIAGC